jgi:hypothetical protein
MKLLFAEVDGGIGLNLVLPGYWGGAEGVSGSGAAEGEYDGAEGSLGRDADAPDAKTSLHRDDGDEAFVASTGRE